MNNQRQNKPDPIKQFIRPRLLSFTTFKPKPKETMVHINK